MLHLHIPQNTYPERILRQLEKLYNECAKLSYSENREEKLEMIHFAVQYCREHYQIIQKPQRVQIEADGVVTVSEESVSNIRIFF